MAEFQTGTEVPKPVLVQVESHAPTFLGVVAATLCGMWIYDSLWGERRRERDDDIFEELRALRAKLDKP